MNRIVLALIVAAAALSANAQTPAKPPTSATPAPKASSPASAASVKKTSATASTPASPPAPWIKLPKGVPAVAHLPVKTIPLSVHYEDIKIGTGAEGESGKVWHIKYSGWRAADGVMFDSWELHGRPVIGSDGKPVLDADGKIKLTEPEPLTVLQGVGRVIPGFDIGLAGMKIGGRRRIFIPYLLAYGTRAMPDQPGHPGIPAKSDLIFDVELVDVTDMPPPMPVAARPIPHPGVSPAPAPSVKPALPVAPAPPPTPPPAPAPPPTPAPTPAPTQPPPEE
jgi:peptidylprolyl isomerase